MDLLLLMFKVVYAFWRRWLEIGIQAGQLLFPSNKFDHLLCRSSSLL